MTTMAQQLEIRRIYSSSPTRAAATIRTKGRERTRTSVLGPLSLIVAAAWIYVAWWPADRLIGANLMGTGLGYMAALSGGELTLADLFGAPPEDRANPAPPEGTEAVLLVEDEPVVGPPEPTPEEIQERAAESELLMGKLYADMWVWLAVTTLGGVCLALAGGAAAANAPVADAAKRRQLGLAGAFAAMLSVVIGAWLWKQHGGHDLHQTLGEVGFVAAALVASYLFALALTPRVAGRLAVVLTLLLVGIGGFAWHDWAQEEFKYPAFAVRIVPVVLMVIAAVAGAAMFRRVARLHRVSVAAVLAATAVTVIALKVAESLGGVHTHQPDTGTYAMLVVAQSSYAWVLLAALALRLR